MKLVVEPVSALVGVAVLGLLLVATGAGQHSLTNPSPSFKKLPVEKTLRIEGIPTIDDVIEIVGGEPYTVPAGKQFVVVSAGSIPSGEDYPRLLVDGAEFLSFELNAGTTRNVSFVPLGPSVAAGSVVEFEDTPGQPQHLAALRAWGYLADD